MAFPALPRFPHLVGAPNGASFAFCRKGAQFSGHASQTRRQRWRRGPPTPAEVEPSLQGAAAAMPRPRGRRGAGDAGTPVARRPGPTLGCGRPPRWGVGRMLRRRGGVEDGAGSSWDLVALGPGSGRLGAAGRSLGRRGLAPREAVTAGTPWLLPRPKGRRLG